MKILFTSPVIEHPNVGRDQLRIKNSIKTLSKNSKSHIVSRNSKKMMDGKEVHSIIEWTKYCFEINNRNLKDFVTVDSNYTPQYNILFSKPRLLRALGWYPQVNFHQFADVMLEI